MRRPPAYLLALLAACHCQPPGPPDEHVIDHMKDAYEKAPARDTVPDLERAVVVVGYAAKKFHYGDVPVTTLRLHANETWAFGFIKFLADGSDNALRLAWYDLLLNMVKNSMVPSELKFQIRKEEGQIYELLNTKADPEVIRRHYEAQIAWMLYLLGMLTPDSGFR